MVSVPIILFVTYLGQQPKGVSLSY